MPLFSPVLHPVFETLGYVGGYALYQRSRTEEGDPLEDTVRWQVIAAAAIGALLGSRLLGVLEQLSRLQANGIPAWRAFLLSGGKTIVGGLLGGWLAVELAKRLLHVRRRTGDLFAIPLCLGIAIGRVGCFLAGLADDTYGTPTRLPWGVDFGDGIRRHPTQLYELAFLLILGLYCMHLKRRRLAPGSAFRVFLAGYLGFRLLVDFLKPQPSIGPMNLIQWACAAGLCFLTGEYLMDQRHERTGGVHPG